MRDCYAVEDDAVRFSLTAGWFGKVPSDRWPDLDRVLALNRYDLVRRETVAGLVAALGPVIVI